MTTKEGPGDGFYLVAAWLVLGFVAVVVAFGAAGWWSLSNLVLAILYRHWSVQVANRRKA